MSALGKFYKHSPLSAPTTMRSWEFGMFCVVCSPILNSGLPESREDLISMGMFPDRNGPQCGRSLIASSTVSIVRLSIRICDLRRISIRPAKRERIRMGGLKSRGIFLSRPEARSKPVSPRTPHSLHHQAIPGFLFPIK